MMRTIGKIVSVLKKNGDKELDKIDISKEEAEPLEKKWEEFIQLLDPFQKERICLVKGDTFDEDHFYLLITCLKTCQH